jgi:hypothetical protein
MALSQVEEEDSSFEVFTLIGSNERPLECQILSYFEQIYCSIFNILVSELHLHHRRTWCVCGAGGWVGNSTMKG